MGIRIGLVAALTLWAAGAAASPAEPIGTFAQLQPLGWTADGASFAFRAKEDSVMGGMPAPGTEMYRADVGVVVDVATGQATYYLVKLDGEPFAANKRRLGPLRPKELEHWIASHKPRLVKGRRDATFELGKDQDLPPLAGAWDHDAWQVSEKDPENEDTGGAHIAIAVGKRVVLRVTMESGSAPVTGSITPFWSPDGRRVAWWVHHDQAGADFPPYDELWITPARGPRVDVKPDKALAPAAREAALRALDHAGFAPVLAGDAGAHRAATVVYAAAGFEADAQRAAKALGGTVDKLTWKPDADLVVALGGGGPTFACAGREAKLSMQRAHGAPFLVTLSCEGDVPRITTGTDGDPPLTQVLAPDAWDGVWKQLEAAHWRTASTSCKDMDTDPPWFDVTVRQGTTTRHFGCAGGTNAAGTVLGAAISNAQQLPKAP